jgi:RND family efflux transporter MFP subunit
MAFTIPVEVRRVLVKGGQAVKKDELLLRARDDEQVAVVEGQRIQAENRNRIMNAELQQELADLQFKRIKEAMDRGGANQVEFDQRRIEASSAAIAVAQEKTNHELEKKRLSQAEGLLARYSLTAPFDAIVEQVSVEEGQGVRESEPVIRLVNIDRLRLEAYAPTQETIRLSLNTGSKVWVLVALPDKPLYVEGKVEYVSPVADSVSQTRRVQVEIENPEGWPAGLQAMVRFTDPGPEWSEYRLVPTNRSGAAAVTPGASVSDAR